MMLTEKHGIITLLTIKNSRYKTYGYRSSGTEVFCKKGVLKILQNSQENTCARV